MPDSRSYYEAYDDRYRQVHGEKMRWYAAGIDRYPAGLLEDDVRGCQAKELILKRTGSFLKILDPM